MENETKSFLKSKSLWGSAAAFFGVLLPGLGVPVSPTDVSHLFDSAMQFVDSALTFGGLVMAFYGRVMAKKPLHVTRAN